MGFQWEVVIGCLNVKIFPDPPHFIRHFLLILEGEKMLNHRIGKNDVELIIGISA